VKLKPSFEIPDHTLLEDVDLPTRIMFSPEWHQDGWRAAGNVRGDLANLPRFWTSIGCVHSRAFGFAIAADAAP
jgi:hypothetical protein